MENAPQKRSLHPPLEISAKLAGELHEVSQKYVSFTGLSTPGTWTGFSNLSQDFIIGFRGSYIPPFAINDISIDGNLLIQPLDEVSKPVFSAALFKISRHHEYGFPRIGVDSGAYQAVLRIGRLFLEAYYPHVGVDFDYAVVFASSGLPTS